MKKRVSLPSRNPPGDGFCKIIHGNARNPSSATAPPKQASKNESVDLQTVDARLEMQTLVKDRERGAGGRDSPAVGFLTR